MVGKVKRYVILVGDGLQQSHWLSSLLMPSFYCDIADGGRRGIARHQQLLKYEPLVVCDSGLSEMSSFEVCRIVKQENAHTPVVLIIHENTEERLLALQAYADSYLSKQQALLELPLLLRNIDLTSRYKHTPTPPVNFICDQYVPQGLEEKVRAVLMAHYSLPPDKRTEPPYTSKRMATYCNKAHRSFQREIKQASGYSFAQLHLMIRLDKAKYLLDRNYSITQVADYLLFSSPSHLSRAFKCYFGINPSKYANF